MQIETALNVGQRVWFMLENKAVSAPIRKVTTVSREDFGETHLPLADVEYETGPQFESERSLQIPAQTFSEESLETGYFTSKEALLASL